jgi:GT2 family glycosyltransferase/glycosyltransferase involved in cell wall biosynthesis
MMREVSAQVDIVVPVVNAPDDVRRCVERVIACTARPFRLLLIDDASGDPRIAALFEELSYRGDSRIVLMHNARRSGFAATVNRGIAHSRADVVLLDPATVPTRHWLDALVHCGESDTRIGTVTPFSSSPRAAFDGDASCGTFGEVDDPECIRQALADVAVPTYPDLPSGSAACMLIRRSALDAVGPFDPAFDRCGGGDVDFCLRAARAGFRNVLADDAYVVRASTHPFEGWRVAGSSDTGLLERLHPHYAAMTSEHAAADPLRALRDAARSHRDAAASGYRVLHVVHDLGGGTEAHVRALIEASPGAWHHYLATAVGNRWQVEAGRGSRATVFAFVRRDDESWSAFVGGIVAAFGISLVHVHHVSGSRVGALEALPALGIPYGFTIHDLWLACPTVTLTDAGDRYCGGVTDLAVCTSCLAAMPSLSDVDIAAWREAHAALLSGAAFLIAPSRWAADMLARYFPQVRGRVDVIAHATPNDARGPTRSEPDAPLCAALLPRDDIPTVAVVGAIGRDKGARRIERLVERARERAARIRFVVIGYLDVQHQPWQSDDALLTVHGRYARDDLPALFAHYRVEFVFYPSQGPESFSYTLSEAWRAGVPALVPPIGALAERVAGTDAGWIMTDDEWRDDHRMLDRLLLLLSDTEAQTRRRAADHARAAAHPTSLAMSQATVANYAKALALPRPAPTASPLSKARLRDALGYRPWVPPVVSSPVVAPPEGEPRKGVWRRVALHVLAMRRTRMGRLLYRVTPEPVIDALKARLHG